MLRNQHAKKGKAHQHKAKLQYQAEYKRPEHRHQAQEQVTVTKNKSVDHSDNRELNSDQKLFCLMIAINLLIFMIPQVQGESIVQHKHNLNRSQFDKHSSVSSHSMFNHTVSSEKPINDIQPAQVQQPKTVLCTLPPLTVSVCSPINDKCVAIERYGKNGNAHEYIAYLSQDKGKTWQRSEKINANDAYRYEILSLRCGTDGTHCVAVGRRGLVDIKPIALRTADSGNTWVESIHRDNDCDEMPPQRNVLYAVGCDDTGLDCTAVGICEDSYVGNKPYTAKV